MIDPEVANWGEITNILSGVAEGGHLPERVKRLIRSEREEELRLDNEEAVPRHISGKRAFKAVREEHKKLRVRVDKRGVRLEGSDLSDKKLNKQISRINLRLEKALGIKYVLGDMDTATKQCPKCGSIMRGKPIITNRSSDDRQHLQCPHSKCPTNIILIRKGGRAIARNARTGAIVKL
jgi:hypothetical protein